MSNDEEQITIRVRTSDNQEMLWSQKAVQRAGTLSDMHLHADSDGVLVVDRPAPAVCVVAAICESADESVYSVADVALEKLVDAMEAAHYLAADGALGCLANELFRRMAGKSVDALVALPAHHPLEGDELITRIEQAALSRLLYPSADEAITESERASLLAEPLFEPEDIAGYEDYIQAALKHAPSALLRTLKGVSTTWRKRARFELCSRTDLDAESLIREGRPWEVVTAGLQLPNLARLCGYGFTVDVAMVRAADLEDTNIVLRGKALRGCEALRACITPGEGEVPQELLAVAVLSAGSGVVAGIPVQRLREEAGSSFTINLMGRSMDEPYGASLDVLVSLLPIMGSHLTSLDISRNGIGAIGGVAIAEILKINGSLKEINLKGNTLGDRGWCAIFDALRDNKDNKIAKWDLFNEQGINPTIAKSLAAYMAVSGSLTTLHLAKNQLGDEGAKAISAALAVNGSLTSLDVGFNGVGKEAALELVSVFKEKQMTSVGLAGCSLGAYGANIVAEYVCVSGYSLTSLDLRSNGIGRALAERHWQSGKAITEAIRVNEGLVAVCNAKGVALYT